MNEKSVKTVRRNRILEFLGWMLGVLGLLFVALSFSYTSQLEGEVDEGAMADLQTLSDTVNAQTNAMDAALKEMDSRFSEYIKGDIATPSDLEDKIKLHRQLVNSGIVTIKSRLEPVNVAVDRNLYDLILARYESSLTDKARMQEYLTGKINCTEAMKQKCCEGIGDPPQDDPSEELQRTIDRMKRNADDIIAALGEIKGVTNYDGQQRRDRLNKTEYQTFRNKMQTIARKANDIKNSN